MLAKRHRCIRSLAQKGQSNGLHFIVPGTGTVVTGGGFVDMQCSISSLLGLMERGEIRGDSEQCVEPGDIAIIPKSMPHGWLTTDNDAISYIIFHGDPNEGTGEKTE